MTTRLKGFTVILENDIREDCADEIINAIKMVKGVQQVVSIEQDGRESMTEMKVRLDVAREIMDFARNLYE